MTTLYHKEIGCMRGYKYNLEVVNYKVLNYVSDESLSARTHLISFPSIPEIPNIARKKSLLVVPIKAFRIEVLVEIIASNFREVFPAHNFRLNHSLLFQREVRD